MAIATGVIISGQSSSTAGTTLTLSIPSGVVAGHLVVVWIGFDNTSATAPTVSSITKPGAETGTWTRIASHNSSTATAAGGVRGEMWAIYTSSTWGVFNATITFSASITKKALSGYSYTGLSGLTIRNTAGTGTSTSGVPTATTTGTTPEIGDLALGGATFENNANPSIDTDTTGGSWDTGNPIATTGGGAAANVATIIQHKILTGANHQTYNPTGASDSGAAVVILVAPTPPAVTQAAYRWYDNGNENSATPHVPQSTAYDLIKAYGGNNFMLRIRLQNGATTVASTSDWTLQYRVNAGSWATPTSTPGPAVRTYFSGNSLDSTATTNQLTGGTGTFVAGLISGDAVVDNLGLSANNYTEVLYTVYVDAAVVTIGDVVQFRVLLDGSVITYSATPTMNIAAEPPTVKQQGYRFFNDGTETGSTALAAQNTAYTANLASGSMNLQLRFRLRSWTTTAPPATTDWQLQYEKNTSGTWVDVTTSSTGVKGYNSANLTDDAATTTERVYVSGTFRQGKISEDGLVSDFTWPFADATEMLYSLTLVAADLANADVLKFRVLQNNSTVDMVYEQTPTITVTKGTPPVASFTSDRTAVAVYGDVIFTDTSTNTPTSWSWNFGTGASPATASTQGPHTVTYDTVGTSTVTLTATNADGSDASDPTNITVATLAVALSNYRFYADDNVQSLSTALASQNTAPSIDVSANNVNAQLRFMLQSTSVIPPEPYSVRVQWEKNASGQWSRLNPLNVGEYLETNQSSSVLVGGTADLQAVGQNFNSLYNYLGRAGFYIKRSGAADNIFKAYVYEVNWDGDPIPTGSPIATSIGKSSAGFSSSYQWVYFDFAGDFLLDFEYPYFITIGVDTKVANASIEVGIDNSSPTHYGNIARSTSGSTWTANTAEDLLFQVQSADPVITFNTLNLSDGAPTSNRLTGGTGSFTNGKVSENGEITGVSWSGNGYTELLYSVSFVKNYVSSGDTLRFRVEYNDSSSFVTNSQVPTAFIPFVYTDSTGLTDTVQKIITKDTFDIASMLRDGGGVNILGIESSFETDTNADGLADGWRLPTGEELTTWQVPDSKALVATMASPSGHGSYAQSITRSAGSLRAGIVGPMIRITPGNTSTTYVSIHNPGASAISIIRGIIRYESGGSLFSATSGSSLAAGATTYYTNTFVSSHTGTDINVAPVIGINSTSTGTIYIDKVNVYDGTATQTVSQWDYFNPANRIQLFSGGAALTHDTTDNVNPVDTSTKLFNKNTIDNASMLRDGGGVNILGIESSFETDTDLNGFADGWTTETLGGGNGVSVVDSGALVSTIGGGHGSKSQQITVGTAGSVPLGILGPMVETVKYHSTPQTFPRMTVSARVYNPGAVTWVSAGFLPFYSNGVTVGILSDSATMVSAGQTTTVTHAVSVVGTSYVKGRPFIGIDNGYTGTIVVDSFVLTDGSPTAPTYDYFNPANRIQLTVGGTAHVRDYSDNALSSIDSDDLAVPLVGQVFDHHDSDRWVLSGNATWAPNAYRIDDDWGSIDTANYSVLAALSPGTRLFSKVTFETAPTDVDCWGEFSINTPNEFLYLGVGDNILYAGNGTVGTYDPVNHAWLGIRFETDGYHYETSPDGSTWTQVHYQPDTIARPIQWSASAYWEFGGNEPNTMYVHSFNGIPLDITNAVGLTDTKSTVPPSGVITSRPKVWTGSWTTKPAKVWMGSSWVEKPVKYWNGSQWKLIGAATPASIVGSSYVNQNTLETSMIMTLPTGLVDGDRLYIAATCGDSTAGTTITESTTGWTTITSKANQGTTQRAFYTAIYSAGLTAPSWSLSVGRKSSYACVAIRNPSASPQVSLTDLGSSTTALVAPSISSAPQGVLLRFYVRKDNLSASVTPPTGTLVTGALGIATGPSNHILVYSQTPAEPTGTATLTMSVASANGSSWTVAV